MKDHNEYNLIDFTQDKTFLSYVDGTNEESVKYWEDYINAHPEKHDLIEQARFLIHSTLSADKSMLGPKIKITRWIRFVRAIDEFEATKNPFHLLPLIRFIVIVIVSVFLIVAVMMFALDRYIRYRDQQLRRVVKVGLQNGSYAKLSRYSQISYDPASNPREIWVNGDVYFEIADGHPFVVHANATEFLVEADYFIVETRDNETHVRLNDGEVVIRDYGELITLPITVETGNLQRDTSRTETRLPVDRIDYDLLKSDKVLLDMTTIEEIAGIIRVRYALIVDIRVKNLETRTASGEIYAPDSNAFLAAVANAFGIKVSRKGNVVILGELHDFY